MKQTTTPKKPLTDRQKKLHAKFKTMAPALIIKPLRYIARKAVGVKIEKGELVKVYEPVFYVAQRAAQRGDGATVQRIAMGLA